MHQAERVEDDEGGPFLQVPRRDPLPGRLAHRQDRPLHPPIIDTDLRHHARDPLRRGGVERLSRRTEHDTGLVEIVEQLHQAAQAAGDQASRSVLERASRGLPVMASRSAVRMSARRHSALTRGHDGTLPAREPFAELNAGRDQRRAVVLIDEIDKAHRTSPTAC